MLTAVGVKGSTSGSPRAWGQRCAASDGHAAVLPRPSNSWPPRGYADRHLFVRRDRLRNDHRAACVSGDTAAALVASVRQTSRSFRFAISFRRFPNRWRERCRGVWRSRLMSAGRPRTICSSSCVPWPRRQWIRVVADRPTRMRSWTERAIGAVALVTALILYAFARTDPAQVAESPAPDLRFDLWPERDTSYASGSMCHSRSLRTGAALHTSQ